MAQSKTTVINKVLAELAELKQKIVNLETFMTSGDFMDISEDQRILLVEQHTTMERYKSVLIKRVYILRRELAEEESTMGPKEPFCEVKK